MPTDPEPPASPDTSRLTELEATLAHLERNYDALNAVVVEQARTLARLQKRLTQLDETLKSQEVDRPAPASTKPPHY